MRDCGGGGGRIKASPRGQMVRPLEVGCRRGEAAHAGWLELGDAVWSQSCILSSVPPPPAPLLSSPS